MPTKHIIFVPGKNPKPPSKQHREMLWKTMLEGVRRADSKLINELQTHYTQFHLISWNYLFYHTHKDITSELPWVDALMNKHGPTEQDIREANSWHIRLNRILFSLADHLPFIIRFLPKDVQSAATEMNRYFNNTNNIACEIRELLKVTLRPLFEKQEPILLIGHSLGTVIAYDTLWELAHEEGIHGKLDFITIGSPLGMHYVQRRLKGIHANIKIRYTWLIRHWINLSSEGDIIALERNFHDCFAEMLSQGRVKSIEDYSHGIYNFFRSHDGLNCHRSYGYLVNPVVGKVIADWWKHH